jgi:hypothetical protein
MRMLGIRGYQVSVVSRSCLHNRSCRCPKHAVRHRSLDLLSVANDLEAVLASLQLQVHVLLRSARTVVLDRSDVENSLQAVRANVVEAMSLVDHLEGLALPPTWSAQTLDDRLN